MLCLFVPLQATDGANFDLNRYKLELRTEHVWLSNLMLLSWC